ncbi:STY4851/ECs_5259 family protein [Paramagnetospirillum caucaseum]|uniref:STY4851/ECs_5259 family protein n=1 Tax=Paramagnetospirillum caucaseum TaxID=1244869 RepID=UPI00034B8976|nr:STY4851/ECs_5259 family protein [Paramagnetospirillum caucaseum]
MQVVQEILGRSGLEAPDGRPLHIYGCTEDERVRLSRDLRLRIASGQVHRSTASGFVLWAAEHIRSLHPGGQLTWAFVFEGLRLTENQAVAVKLVDLGIPWWRRKVRLSEARHHLYLYSLMAEGGLPDALVAEAGRYQGAIVAITRDIEAERELGPQVAYVAGCRHVASLPQVFRTEETARLLSDLALALVGIRRRLPEDLPAEAAERWLDVHDPGWKSALPFRLSPAALVALVRPALAAERGAVSPAGGLLAWRELHRRADGNGWAGVAVLADGGLLPERLLDGVSPDLRLRLIPRLSTGAATTSLLGIPDVGGWRVLRLGAHGNVPLPLEPEQPLVLSAHADGRLVGEAVVDAGMPAVEEAPSLWRSPDPNTEFAAHLVPLSGRGRTRADVVWLLSPSDSPPDIPQGVTIGRPEPAPGGWLWPLCGRGEVEIGGLRLRIATGEDTEEAAAHLLALGQGLVGWTAINGVTVIRGTPEFWGSLGDGVLRRLGKEVLIRPLPHLLHGRLAEWLHDGDVVARMRLVALPDTLAFDLLETRSGEVRLEGGGLEPGSHVALTAQGGAARAVTDSTGRVALDLAVPGQAPGLLYLRLSDACTGAALSLAAPWPSRSGMLVDPQGKRLERDRPIALGSLAGWRGFLPSSGGALQMRIANGGAAVAVQVQGEVRLAAYEPLLRSILALAGPDARVNLNVIAGGDPGRRLEIGRYDWIAAIEGDRCRLGPGRTHLHAITLSEPLVVHQRHAEGEIDLRDWLGGAPVLWFVQGRSDQGGVMRPFPWSAVPMRRSTRQERIGGYTDKWKRLLGMPCAPEWRSQWALIRAAREGGDAGALDQVQALGQVPAAAVVILFRVKSEELAEALALEDAAPIWWPLLTCSDWVTGLSVDLNRQRSRFHEAAFDPLEGEALSQQTVARRAGQILALRPELRGHLAHAFLAAGMQPFALPPADGAPIPLRAAKPRERIDSLAQETARRFSRLPDGTSHVVSRRVRIGENLNPYVRPLLDGPVVVAEAALRLRAHPDLAESLRILTLRLADPVWFDEALPVAIELVLEGELR